MGVLYPMYRTKARRSVAVAAAAAHLTARAGRLDRSTACVDGVPRAAEGVEPLPFRAAGCLPVAGVVVERVAVIADLLRADLVRRPGRRARTRARARPVLVGLEQVERAATPVDQDLPERRARKLRVPTGARLRAAAAGEHDQRCDKQGGASHARNYGAAAEAVSVGDERVQVEARESLAAAEE